MRTSGEVDPRPVMVSQNITSGPSISSLAIACDSLLTGLLEIIRLSPYQSLENATADESGRYKIWAANIGALRDAKSATSLDSRVKSSSRMRQNVASGLERLRDAVERAADIVAEIMPNRTTSSILSQNEIRKLTAKLVNEDGLDRAQSGTTELAELFLNIRSCITNLFALSTLIRQDRPRGRVQRQGPPMQTQSDAEPDITNVKDKFPKLRERPWLAERIGKRITQQRDYIRYRQAHREKLAKRTAERVAQDGDSEIVSTNATTKATTFVEQLAVIDETNEVTGETFTEGSVHTEATSFATTALGVDGLGRSIPSLTTMWLDGVRLDYDKHIECPYCRTIQTIADRSDWKHHVYRDLQTYSCTFQDCSSESFQTSHEWFKHELDFHRRQWKCNQCSTKCDTASALETHFTSRHSKTVSAGQIKIMVKACEKAITHFDDTACPLCNNWKAVSATVNNSSKFRSHLAKHLQELAREALPLSIDGLEIREETTDAESVSTDDSDSTYDTPPGLACMLPYGKLIKGTRKSIKDQRWRCLVEGRSGLCQTTFSGLLEFRRHAGVAHPELKLGRVVCRSVCPRCDKILLTARICNCSIDFPEVEDWLYANSDDIKNDVDAIDDHKRRAMLNSKVDDETKRKSWRAGVRAEILGRREKGMEHDPFMEAYLASEHGNPSFQPSDSDYIRETVPVIKFTDVLDRTFHFPLNVCLEYQMMVRMVKLAFLYEDFGPIVTEGRFQLLDTEGKGIDPAVWDRVIGPGSLVGMLLLDGDNFNKPHVHQLRIPDTVGTKEKQPRLSKIIRRALLPSTNASSMMLNEPASDEHHEYSGSLGTEIRHSGESKSMLGVTDILARRPGHTVRYGTSFGATLRSVQDPAPRPPQDHEDFEPKNVGETSATRGRSVPVAHVTEEKPTSFVDRPSPNPVTISRSSHRPSPPHPRNATGGGRYPLVSSEDKTNTHPPPPVGHYGHLESDARVRAQYRRETQNPEAPYEETPFKFTYENFESLRTASWTPRMVAQSMHNAGIDLSSAGRFIEHDIDGSVLYSMGQDDLKEIGIVSSGMRTKVWRHIEKLKSENL